MKEIKFAKPEHALCRMFLHAWEPSHVELNGRFFEYVAVCDRCGGEKRQSCSAKTGKFLDSAPRAKYRMPKGYRLIGSGKEGITRADIRLSFLRSQVGPKRATRKRATVTKIGSARKRKKVA